MPGWWQGDCSGESGSRAGYFLGRVWSPSSSHPPTFSITKQVERQEFVTRSWGRACARVHDQADSPAVAGP